MSRRHLYTQCPQKNVLLCRALAKQSKTFFWGHCVIFRLSLRIYRMLLFSIHFLVSSIGCAHKCSLELALPLLPELAHHRHAELLYLVHGLLGILTA